MDRGCGGGVVGVGCEGETVRAGSGVVTVRWGGGEVGGGSFVWLAAATVGIDRSRD